jgi:hypothetical protein
VSPNNGEPANRAENIHEDDRRFRIAKEHRALGMGDCGKPFLYMVHLPFRVDGSVEDGSIEKQTR